MATYSEYLDSKPLPKRGWRRIRRHLPRLSVLLMTLLLIGIVLWPYVVVSADVVVADRLEEMSL